MDKAPPRTSQLSGMGWLMETVNTPGECHKMLRMNEHIFFDLHDVLVERYGLKPSKHMTTYEMLAIFLFICAGSESNRRAYPHFKDCIGALDGTHIRVSLSPEEQVRYIGKTGIATQNVLAVCDFDMRFTYVAAGQPGALHDTSVLYHALEADAEVFPHPPQGIFFLKSYGCLYCYIQFL